MAKVHCVSPLVSLCSKYARSCHGPLSGLRQSSAASNSQLKSQILLSIKMLITAVVIRTLEIMLGYWKSFGSSVCVFVCVCIPGVYRRTSTACGVASSSEGLILCFSVSAVVLGTIIGTRDTQKRRIFANMHDKLQKTTRHKAFKCNGLIIINNY